MKKGLLVSKGRAGRPGGRLLQWSGWAIMVAPPRGVTVEIERCHWVVLGCWSWQDLLMEEMWRELLAQGSSPQRLRMILRWKRSENNGSYSSLSPLGPSPLSLLSHSPCVPPFDPLPPALLFPLKSIGLFYPRAFAPAIHSAWVPFPDIHTVASFKCQLWSHMLKRSSPVLVILYLHVSILFSTVLWHLKLFL